MVDVTGKAPSVELTDALKAGFDAAMSRVAELSLDPCITLVDQIPSVAWTAWDATSENALVIDSDGLNGDDELDHGYDMAA